MNIKDLKVGDMVFIREDVNNSDKKWANKYDTLRLTGAQQIFKVDYDNECFWIIGELDKAYVDRHSYTVEMIEKLSNLENYSEDLRTWGLMRELLLPTLPIYHFKEIEKLINEAIKLEVGDFVVLRDDLVSGKEYDGCLYLSTMAYSFNKDKLIDEKIPCLRIKEYFNTLLKSGNPGTINHFVVYDQPPFMSYSYEMLHWEKSIILNYLISKLNFCIEEAMYILDRVYENYMSTVNSSILSDKQYTSNEEKYIDTTSNEEKYIDLELKVTSVLRLHDMILDKNTLTSKVTDDMLNTLTIKTIRSNEEHDIEKAVMMTILKGLGIKYSEIEKCVNLVQEKWIPSQGDTYFFMNDDLEVDFDSYTGGSFDRAHISSGNYFKSRSEASAKVEKVRKMFNEDVNTEGDYNN